MIKSVPCGSHEGDGYNDDDYIVDEDDENDMEINMFMMLLVFKSKIGTPLKLKKKKNNNYNNNFYNDALGYGDFGEICIRWC